MTTHIHPHIVIRRRRSGYALVLALAMLVTIASLVTAPLASAAAQNPNKPFTEDVDTTFPAPNLTAQCGVEIWANVSGTITFQSKPGGVDHIRIRYTHTFTGPGGSVSVNRVENVRYALTVLPDGTEIEELTITGTLMYHMVLPGYGSLTNNSGREILQLTWQYDEVADAWVLLDEQVLFDAGPNDDPTDADFEVICAQLV